MDATYTGSNRALFLMSLIANFAITNQLVTSLGVSITLLFLGKLLDYFVKPVVDAWFQSRKHAKKGHAK